MTYSPKYIDVDDVPVQIPDDYDQSDKLDAIELAESLLELELNEGRELTTVTAVHEAAIKQRATCELAKGAEDPDSVSIGDIRDDGSNKSDYAHQAFRQHYEELVNKIQAFMETGESGPYVYSTEKSDDQLEWDQFEENIDIDWSNDFARRDDI